METPAARTSMKIVEVTQVSPIPLLPVDNAHQIQNSLPLTCFDFIWIKFPPVERVFFYEFTASSIHFNTIVLPRLKQSLALALSYYRPLASHLCWDQHDPKPYILCAPTDSVSVIVAESNPDNFDKLSRKENIVNAIELRSYAPSLQITDQTATVISVQITFFPGSGFSIGFAAHHGILDGKSAAMFIKSWAYLCRNLEQENENSPKLPHHMAPFFDRSVIKDPTDKIAMLYLNRWLIAAKKNPGANPQSMKVLERGGAISENHVRATFELSKQDISTLRGKVKSKSKCDDVLHLSSFVLTYAHAIVCFVKTKAAEINNEKVNFIFAADFRNRLVPPVPANYFGNCIGSDKMMVIEAKDVVGDEGLVIVAKTISDAVTNLGKYEYYERAEEVHSSFSKLESSPFGLIGVAGSPKLEVYSVDFGWGRPRKVDVVSIDKGHNFSLAESRDQSGGMEIGFVMKTQEELEAFASFFIL
ncbi:hypothetical protein ACFE04_003104 [Oxalis oulophora]